MLLECCWHPRCCWRGLHVDLGGSRSRLILLGIAGHAAGPAHGGRLSPPIRVRGVVGRRRSGEVRTHRVSANHHGGGGDGVLTRRVLIEKNQLI